MDETAFWVNRSPHDKSTRKLFVLLTCVNENVLLKAEVVAPYVHKFTHIIFSKFTFES